MKYVDERYGISDRLVNDDVYGGAYQIRKLEGRIADAKKELQDAESELRNIRARLAINQLRHKAAVERVERCKFNIYEPD